MFTALIRTHHITSRRKIVKLRSASHQNAVFVLLKTGSPPGIMYAEGSSRAALEEWVGVVQVSLFDSF